MWRLKTQKIDDPYIFPWFKNNYCLIYYNVPHNVLPLVDHNKTLIINGHTIWKIRSFCETPYLQSENEGYGCPKTYSWFLQHLIPQFPHKIATPQGLNIIREKNYVFPLIFLKSKTGGNFSCPPSQKKNYPLNLKYHNKKGSCFFPLIIFLMFFKLLKLVALKLLVDSAIFVEPWIMEITQYQSQGWNQHFQEMKATSSNQGPSLKMFVVHF